MNFKNIFKDPKKLIWSVAGVAVVAVGLVFAFSSSKPKNQYVPVKKENVIESISASGNVKAAQDIDLGFERGGRISSVKVDVGDSVSAGEVLATVDSSDIYAQYQGAQAALASQQAKYNSMKTGARPETVALDNTAISGAQASVSQAEDSVRSTLQDAYNKSDDAVHNQVDQLFSNARTNNPTLMVNINNGALQSTIQNDRLSMEALLAKWQNDLLSIDTAQGDALDASIDETKSNLSQVSNFLLEISSALNSVTVNTNPQLSQATITQYKTNITTARANVSNDISAVISTALVRSSAETALSKANEQLTLDQAGATPDDLSAQASVVAAAQATVNGFAADLGQAVITAPISGTITVNNIHVGQIAAPSVTVMSMQSDSEFQIDVYLSENDVAHVKVGDIASTTLQSYPGSQLAATVISVDPAATMTNGVSSYKTTLQFDESDPRIKEGLTANVSINAGGASDVLVVPESALIVQGTSTYVLKNIGGKTPALVEVNPGITDAQGNTEILSGLNEGDQVAAFGQSSIQ